MSHPGFVVAAATLAVVLAGCGKPQDGGGTAAVEPASAPAQPTEAEKQALLAALPGPYNTGDLVNGQAKFALCRSCHTLDPGGSRMTGPNLHGVFGRKAATGDFNYSDALKASGLTWDVATMDRWIADPRGTVPNNKMSFAGLRDAKDRRDVVAYLAVETGHPPN